ncbi:rhodanese-like domain-containing protein [Bacillus marinisedimentorum]|uniref:rhodanese-like domain-containing protein n=1 Tax=Bacillus marinisedimentorum TaxID=1821260 RepID=UPI000871C25C|nr:rhodanese-like domain-containing protein [Bacillus marinisedimentorum]
MSVKTVMTPDEVKEKLEKGEKMNVIDVREHEEVAEGMIPGAKHIPLGEIQERANELEKGKEYIMVCRSGNRSGMATEYLNSQGFTCINMVGGMMNWTGKVK